jgi:hypothetical protein
MGVWNLIANVCGTNSHYAPINEGDIVFSNTITNIFSSNNLITKNLPLKINKWEISYSNYNPAYKIQYNYQLNYAHEIYH